MRFEWLIAKRYLWSKRRHPFVGVVSFISVLGITVGVAALITVLAVMNGFDEDLKNRIIGTRAHVLIEKNGSFNEWPSVIAALKSKSSISGAAPFVEGQALIQKGEWGAGVLVRGIDSKAERQVSRFNDYLSVGELSDRTGSAVIGSELSRRAGLVIGSQFQIATQNLDKPFAATVEGIFSSGMYEYDANMIYLNLADSQAIFGLERSVTGVSVFLKNAEKAEQVKNELYHLFRPLGPGQSHSYSVRTWMDLNRTLFSALKLEKIVMFLILALIILVACLNIAGCLTLLVMDKTKDIGVLKALGASPASLVKIFALDGLALGVLGSGSGFAVGAAICFCLKKYKFIELPKEIYYIDTLPVQLKGIDTLWVLLVAIALSLVSALYPAWVAGKLDPVKALRYE